MNWWVA